MRRAALALAREVERRAPDIATSKWWKEERHGVFIDYNQNAKDRTVASAYSVRPAPDARVSTPLAWDEVAEVRRRRPSPCARCRSGSPATATAHAGIDDDGRHRSTASWSSRPATRPRASATRRGRPTTRRRPTSRRGSQPSKRRMSTKPLIEIGRAAKQAEAIAGLERWKARHPDAWPHLRPADVLVDAMRGRSTTWTRIRLNLENVPPELRPAQEPLDPDYDPGPASTGRESRRLEAGHAGARAEPVRAPPLATSSTRVTGTAGSRRRLREDVPGQDPHDVVAHERIAVEQDRHGHLLPREVADRGPGPHQRTRVTVRRVAVELRPG